MANRLLRIKFEGMMGMAHETAPRTIDIIKNKSDDVYCHYRYRDYFKKSHIIKNKLDPTTIYDFLSQLTSLTLPAFPEHHMGCDGGFTEIEIGDYSGKSHYRWWSAPPKGWKALDEITQAIIEYCDIKEPDLE